MKLKLDENLGRRGEQILLDAAHDVATVADQGLTTAKDAVLIEVCRQEGRCLVTMDMDFANPFLSPPVHGNRRTEITSTSYPRRLVGGIASISRSIGERFHCWSVVDRSTPSRTGLLAGLAGLENPTM
jgi:hypothetical protein